MNNVTVVKDFDKAVKVLNTLNRNHLEEVAIKCLQEDNTQKYFYMIDEDGQINERFELGGEPAADIAIKTSHILLYLIRTAKNNRFTCEEKKYLHARLKSFCIPTLIKNSILRKIQ